MLELFRKIALFEGLTTLALFFVAMPLKYLAGDPRLVPSVGMLHGIAFLAYQAAMILAFWGRGFGAAAWFRTVIASLFPFGTFFNDPFLKQLNSVSLSTAADKHAPSGRGV
jgi:integral membrane protein